MDKLSKIILKKESIGNPKDFFRIIRLEYKAEDFFHTCGSRVEDKSIRLKIII